MAKPKIPNQKKKYQELNRRLAKYVMLVEKIYDNLNLEVAKVVSRTPYDAESEKPFKWSDYPQTKASVDKLQSQFVDEIGAVIYRGTSEEWKESNLVQDLVSDKVLRAYGAQVRGEEYKVFYQTNLDVLKAFQKRKDKGMNVSAKLWNQSKDYKEELEAAISCAIQKGTSAVTLSKQISKYLLDFPSLQKDYKRMYGKASDIKDCEYRSARLARSEINMAYRTAEQARWQQFDFVVGYEIKLSGSHHHRMPHGDICDTLAGKYPKTFKWTGWHPNDLCYVVPILKTEEEFWKWDDEKGNGTGSINEVKGVPDKYKLWVRNNEDRIVSASKRGTLPYFLKDNPEWKDYLSIQYHRLEDAKFDKSFKDVQKSLLRQKYENMVIITKKGKEVLSVKGNTGDVNFNDEQAKMAKDNIVVHNHPIGLQFPANDFRRTGHSLSEKDMFEAVDCDMYSIVAVSPLYRYEAVRPANGWNVSPSEIKQEYKRIYASIQKKYPNVKETPRGFILQHLTMKRLSVKYGFDYKKKKIK